jgi:serine/threonine-protein kinase
MVAATTTEFPPLLAMCPECQRCFDVGLIRAASAELQCPDDEVALQPLMGIVPVVDGKYRVDAVIGRGGMGAVFRARDLRLDRDVAVKVVRADLMADADSLARFQREAQIVARLQHPGIVTVFDYGTLPQGPAFLVMEFVAGEDLRHLLKRERTLSPARTLELMTGIAAGVDAAHRAGVLHRDLKPENVLLPASGTGPKVLDFGVAKMAVSGQAAGAAVTQGATIIGTPAYMAPEQLRGDLLDSRADVYSLTVLAYEMLTGRLPFGAGSFFDVGVRQVDAAARIDFAGVHAGIAETLRAGLSIDRDRRPATARLLVDQLRVTLSPRAT